MQGVYMVLHTKEQSSLLGVLAHLPDSAGKLLGLRLAREHDLEAIEIVEGSTSCAPLERLGVCRLVPLLLDACILPRLVQLLLTGIPCDADAQAGEGHALDGEDLRTLDEEPAAVDDVDDGRELVEVFTIVYADDAADLKHRTDVALGVRGRA